MVCGEVCVVVERGDVDDEAAEGEAVVLGLLLGAQHDEVRHQQLQIVRRVVEVGQRGRRGWRWRWCG